MFREAITTIGQLAESRVDGLQIEKAQLEDGISVQFRLLALVNGYRRYL